MIALKESPSLTLYLGRQGENGVRTLDFDFSDFKKRFGDGVLSLVMRRKQSEDPYPIALEIIPQSIAVWTVSNVETDIVGSGEAQFIYTVNGNVKKTVIYKTKVDASLTPVSETAPEAFQNWLDELSEIGGKISADTSTSLEAIEDAKSNSLTAISNSRTSALDEIDNKAESVMRDMQDAVNDAERYAQQAESYAENLHFSDIGTGNIEIMIGGTNG